MTAADRFQELGGWSAVLGAIAEGRDLSVDQARATMTEVLEGRAGDGQLGGLLVGLRVKGESSDEILGFVEAMEAAAEPLTVPPDTIDIVGTGGSPHRRRHALNVSTMASFVAAACGATVCKHGNRRASSTSGSFDFLEALGVAIDVQPRQLEQCLGETGVGFAFARTFHPAMRFAGPVRTELGVPTVFNILGPLANPGRVRRQLIGTATVERARDLAVVLHRRGSHSSWVVCGAGGLDELTVTGPTKVFRVEPDGPRPFTVDPGQVGLRVHPDDAIAGGDSARNAEVFEAMIDGEESARSDIVVLNAGAALVVAGVAADLADGVAMASKALADGAVRRKLDQVRSVTASLVA